MDCGYLKKFPFWDLLDRDRKFSNGGGVCLKHIFKYCSPSVDSQVIKFKCPPPRVYNLLVALPMDVQDTLMFLVWKMNVENIALNTFGRSNGYSQSSDWGSRKRHQKIAIPQDEYVMKTGKYGLSSFINYNIPSARQYMNKWTVRVTYWRPRKSKRKEAEKR